MEWRFPDVGEGLHEAQIVKWYQSEGEEAVQDQPLLDVETDKAVVTIPAPTTAPIEKILFHEGDTVRVGEVVVTFATGAAHEAAPMREQEASLPEEMDSVLRPVARQGKGPVLATPSVRRLARERGVDISEIGGTGAGGRVMAEDVEKAAAGEATSLVTLPLAGQRAGLASGPAGDLERRPLVGIRKRIADNMARSWAHAVQVTVFEEMNATNLVALRSELNTRVAEEDRFTFLPFIAKATSKMLSRFPDLNSALDEEASEIVTYGRHNIGVAVDDPEGLTVPVLHDIDRLSIKEASRELKRLIQGARDHSLSREELTGSTFTITNYGTIGGVYATPIINYPEVGILGLGPVRRRPVVGENDQIVAADTLTLSLTFDHRVIDGGYASRFLTGLIQLLSDPFLLMVEL